MQRRSIHDIKPSSRLRKSPGYESRRLTRDEEEDDIKIVKRKRSSFEYENPYEPEKSGGGKAIWYVAIFCIVFLVFSLSYFFSSAEVTLTPRVGNIDVNKMLTVSRIPVTSGALSFETVVVPVEESVTVSSTEKEFVENRATGMVRIFNNHSSSAQNLLIDTRLVAEDGKIYKTKRAVSVPGQRVVSGETVPGSVDVEVYADEPGEEYNAENLDLKILGFRGSPRYDNFYARTISPLSGGFIGEMLVIGEEERESKEKELSEKLESEILARIKSELPNGFVIMDGMYIFDKEPIEIGEDDSSQIIQRGKITAFVFRRDLLTKEIVKDLVSDFDKNPVFIQNLETLDFELLSPREVGENPVSNISFSVKGRASVVWRINEEDIINALVGIKERSFETALRDFRNIEKAELSIKPFWKNALPEDRSKIKIINTIND